MIGKVVSCIISRSHKSRAILDWWDEQQYSPFVYIFISKTLHSQFHSTFIILAFSLIFAAVMSESYNSKALGRK